MRQPGRLRARSVMITAVAVAAIVVAATAIAVLTRTQSTSGAPAGRTHHVPAVGAAPRIAVPAGEGVTFTITRSAQAITETNDPLFEQDWQLGPAYAIDPNREPTSATISFPVDVQRLQAAVGDASATPTSMLVQAFEPLTGSWIPLDSAYDPVTHTVTARTAHLSSFIVTWYRSATKAAKALLKAAAAVGDAIYANVKDALGITQEHDECKAKHDPAWQVRSTLSTKLTGCVTTGPKATIQIENDLQVPMLVAQFTGARHSRFTAQPFIARGADASTLVNEVLAWASNRTLVPGHDYAVLNVAAAPSLDGLAADTSPDLLAIASDVIASILEVWPDAKSEDEVIERAVDDVMPAFEAKVAAEGADSVSMTDILDKIDTEVTGKLAAQAGPGMQAAKVLIDAVSCASKAVTDLVNSLAGKRQDKGVLRTTSDLAVSCVNSAFKALGKQLSESAENVVTLLDAVPNLGKRLWELYDYAKLGPSSLFGKVVSVSCASGCAPVMTAAQAAHLPAADLGAADHGWPCASLPAGIPAPAGAPGDPDCVYSVPADLDGNGTVDRLVVWSKLTSGEPSACLDQATRSQCHSQNGAVAYLSDGTAHVLTDPVASWAGAPSPVGDTGIGPRGTGIYPNGVVQLGSDTRQQVSILYLTGANTDWDAALALAADGTLHVVTTQAGTMVPLFDGGGALHPTGWGCVTTGRTRLLAQYRSDEGGQPFSPNGYPWSTRYDQLLDTSLVYAGQRGGLSPSQDTPATNVSTCDVGTSPPDVGTVGRGAVEPAGAAGAVLNAVVSGDLATAEQYSNPDIDVVDSVLANSFHGGDGVDVTNTIKTAVAADPLSWSGAPISCSPVITTAPPSQVCRATAGNAVLSLLVTQANNGEQDDWVVAQAFAGVVADTSSRAFVAPSRNIMCRANGKIPTGNQPLVGDPTVSCVIDHFDAESPACATGQVGSVTVDYLGHAPTVACVPQQEFQLGGAAPIGYGTAVSMGGMATCEVTASGVDCRTFDDRRVFVSRQLVLPK